MTIHEVYRLSELEEIVGDLHSLEITDIGLIALIGKIQVILPEELAGMMQGLIGRRVSVLKLDGYHLHHLE